MMRNILLWFAVRKYFRLLDKYHLWQYKYDNDDPIMDDLRNEIDRLKLKIRVFCPKFPQH